MWLSQEFTMKPLLALAAGLAGACAITAAAAEPGFGAFRGGVRGHAGHIGLPHHGAMTAGRHGHFPFAGYSAPAVIDQPMFTGWSAFQAPSPFTAGAYAVPPAATIVNVTVNPPALYTTATLPTAADLPQVGSAPRAPVGAPVVYVLNGSGQSRPGGARVIEISPQAPAGSDGQGFTENGPTAPRIIELQTE
jgi:hypothetical protein